MEESKHISYILANAHDDATDRGVFPTSFPYSFGPIVHLNVGILNGAHENFKPNTELELVTVNNVSQHHISL